MQLKLVIHAYDICLYISCVFYSGWIISLVAMKNWGFHFFSLCIIPLRWASLPFGLLGCCFLNYLPLWNYSPLKKSKWNFVNTITQKVLKIDIVWPLICKSGDEAPPPPPPPPPSCFYCFLNKGAFARAKISAEFFAKVARLTICCNDFSWDYNGFSISTET